jgi:hypothetical protein
MRGVFGVILNLIGQRRLWAFAVPLIAALVRQVAGIDVPENVIQAVFDNTVAVLVSPQVASVVSAVLALLSFVKPKPVPVAK